MSRQQILYFVKYPEPGKVKTRLAQSVGFEEAARWYRTLAESNLSILARLPQPEFHITVTFDPPEAEDAMKEWFSGEHEYLPQAGEDLGERLANAFASVFHRGAQKVLALGSDTMGLEESHIQDAFRHLDARDVVLGPAKDGGYYLIGLSRPRPLIFKEIPWSTPAVFETTLARIEELDLSCFLLPRLDDLDDAENIPALLGKTRGHLS